MSKKVFDSGELEPKIGVVVGTRPGIVMFAPIIHALRAKNVPHFIIHTGQHYSPNMDDVFFRDLNLPTPEYRLEGVAERLTHGAQTAAMLEGIEAILLKERPKLVLVGGDANTNLAGGLAARKLRIGVGHVEAGERSFDWRMPEEHNRRILDHISDLLFATDERSVAHLRKESVQGAIHITGNPIVDASLQHLELARKKSDVLMRFGLTSQPYALLTMHREENVDFPHLLRNALQGVSQAAVELDLPVLFLVHPRTKKRLKEFGLADWAEQLPGLIMHEAVGYLDFLRLIAGARLVFTDSGGVQQEACIHHVPCVTLRENTEWVATLEYGANRLAGTDPERIVQAASDATQVERTWPVPFGDGRAAERIVDISLRWMEEA
ncbi:UDP-N-acetylglucosamine 2-epimerase (non-hydrolyzing) [Candidatus Parcubacteria bacterium]|nr:MAG: UDP-N-acetylglucosamine 2-epimerase (non-hydrolyzing) [Candidatus Parcubacteria bacterium]